MPKARGFTLIELMIVISIIAILAVVGVVVFTGIQKSARDAKRRGDIEAIAKAYEVKYQAAGGKYRALEDSDFASGSIPVPSEGEEYFNVVDTNGSGFKVCAALESNSADVCNTPSPNCICKVSSQGTIPSGATNLIGDHNEIGLGGSSYSACDTDGTLASGLVGYWKMDENSGTTVADSYGQGVFRFGSTAPTWTESQSGFGSALLFDGVDSSVSTPGSVALNISGNQISFGMWIFLTDYPPGDGFGSYGIFLQKDGYRLLIDRNSGITPQISGGGWMPVTVPKNVWKHIFVTYDADKSSDNVILYLNGAVARKTDLNSAISSTGDLTLGRTEYYSFKGMMDEVRIYNRALDPAEVSALANGCISP